MTQPGSTEQAKIRKDRRRIKNNPALVKTWGNRCGHDKTVLKIFKLPEHSKKRPPVIALAFNRLNRLDDFLKNHTARKMRSERVEACRLLLGALLSRLDLITLCVGVPTNQGQLLGIRLERLAEIAEISFTRAERAMHDLKKAGLIKVAEKCQKLSDGSYKGYAAIRQISKKLFAEIGLSELLAECREKLERKAAKKLNYIPDTVKQEMEKSLEKATNQQAAAVAAGFTPVANFFASARDILQN